MTSRLIPAFWPELNRLTNELDWRIGNILADNQGLLETLDLIWSFSWSRARIPRSLR